MKTKLIILSFNLTFLLLFFCNNIHSEIILIPSESGEFYNSNNSAEIINELSLKVLDSFIARNILKTRYIDISLIQKKRDLVLGWQNFFKNIQKDSTNIEIFLSTNSYVNKAMINDFWQATEVNAEYFLKIEPSFIGENNFITGYFYNISNNILKKLTIPCKSNSLKDIQEGIKELLEGLLNIYSMKLDVPKNIWNIEKKNKPISIKLISSRKTEIKSFIGFKPKKRKDIFKVSIFSLNLKSKEKVDRNYIIFNLQQFLSSHKNEVYNIHNSTISNFKKEEVLNSTDTVIINLSKKYETMNPNIFLPEDKNYYYFIIVSDLRKELIASQTRVAFIEVLYFNRLTPSLSFEMSGHKDKEGNKKESFNLNLLLRYNIVPKYYSELLYDITNEVKYSDVYLLMGYSIGLSSKSFFDIGFGGGYSNYNGYLYGISPVVSFATSPKMKFFMRMLYFFDKDNKGYISLSMGIMAFPNLKRETKEDWESFSNKF